MYPSCQSTPNQKGSRFWCSARTCHDVRCLGSPLAVIRAHLHPTTTTRRKHQLTSMSSHDRTPIIVGVGDFRNKSLEVKDAIEPAELMITAVRRALEDTELTPGLQDELLGLTDSVCVVPPWTWAYPDLPGLLAERLGVNASHMLLGEHGGNQPALLCDIAARRISSGETKAAIIVGGEALASRRSPSNLYATHATWAYQQSQWLPVRRLGGCRLPIGRSRTRQPSP